MARSLLRRPEFAVVVRSEALPKESLATIFATTNRYQRDDNKTRRQIAKPRQQLVGVQHRLDEEKEQCGTPEAGEVAVAAGNGGSADNDDGDRSKKVLLAHR